MAWKCHGILWVQFLHFLLRTNGDKGHLDDNDFCHCYGDLFESAILDVTWSRLCSKFLINSCKGNWQQNFQGHPTPKNVSVPKKSEPVFQRTLRQDRWHLTYF